MISSAYSLKPRCGSLELLRRLTTCSFTHIGSQEVISKKFQMIKANQYLLSIRLKDNSEIKVIVHNEWVFILFNIHSLIIKKAFIHIMRGQE